MSSDLTQTEESLPPTTSLVLLQVAKHAPQLYPKEAVACMQCPVGLWQMTDKSLECYCRVQYKVVWTTAEPGKIRACEGMLQALAKAMEDAKNE